MMKKNVLCFAIILIFLTPAHCVFNTTPTHNFTILPLNNTSATQVALDGNGSRYMIWRRSQNYFTIHRIDGINICTAMGMPTTSNFTEFIWPQNHSPIVSYAQEGKIYIINQTTCQLAVLYNLWNITYCCDTIGSRLNFIWKGNRAILTLNSKKGVYQIDLNSSQLISTFSLTNDSGIDNIVYYYTLYSKDLSYLYVLTQNISESLNVYTINVFENSNQTKPPVKQIILPVMSDDIPGALSNLKESDSGLIYGNVYKPLQNSTNFLIFNASGNLTTKTINNIYTSVRPINDGDLYDTVALYSKNYWEIAKLDDGRILQKLYAPSTQSYFKISQYKNRKLILIDVTGQVLVYTYENDGPSPGPNPNPNPPNPDDGDNNSTTWIIVVCVLVPVLVIGGAAFFFIRKKKLAQKNAGIYGKLNN